MYNYKAIVTNVVDGDTFDMDIDLGFRIHLSERIRLLGCDTPEKFKEEKELGLIVKDYVSQLILGKEVVIRSYKEETDLSTDSFGRWLAEVYIDDKSLTTILTEAGVNKYEESYNEDNVYKLKDLILEQQ